MFDDGLVFLLIVAGFFLFAVPVVAIMALVRSYRLESEVEGLRSQLRSLVGAVPAEFGATAPKTPPLSPRPGLAAADAPPASAGPDPEPAAATAPSPEQQPEPKPVPPVPAPAPAKPRFSLEQALGARAFAWVGALAIALAGVFLVKFSIDQGYLEPPVRIALSTLLGFVLVVAGEWLRRRDTRIAQAVSAAAVAVLFSTLFAAVGLYDMVGRGMASILALVLTALAIGLSLRHGPFVALLGLIGGTVAPAILGDETGDALTLFAYLLALVGGTLAVTRRRHWWWLGWCALPAGGLWALVWLGAGFERGEAVWCALYLLALIGLYVWLAWPTLSAKEGAGLRQELMWTASGTMLVLQAVLVSKTQFAAAHWGFYVVSGLAVFALAWRSAQWQALAVVPVALSVTMFLTWADDFRLFRPEGVDARAIALAGLAVGGVFCAAAYALLWNARRPGFWAALSAGGAFLHFLALCAGLYDYDIGVSWSAASLVLAVPLLLASERVAAWRTRMNGGNEALGMMAIGVTFFVSAAVPLELRREWVTMAYALELPMVAWIAWRLNLPALRWLAWLLVATVTVRLVLNPYVLDYDVSANPLLNWVLYGYGVPIVSYWLAARFLRRVRNDELVMAVEASILAFAFLLLTLQVRSIFNPDGLGQERFATAERAWMAVSWGALALGLAYGAWRRPHPILTWGWRLAGGAAITLAFFGAAVWFDALFVDGGIGRTPIANGLLVCFALPALLAAGGAWMLQRMGERRGATVAGIAALVFGFAFLGYEVRHYFAFATGRVSTLATDSELYAYSIVWLLYGAALLVAGIASGRPVLRYASLAVLVLVVGKVFLVDMADLTGLLRVASFLGLGVALLGLGFLYRRYVFADGPGTADTGSAGR